MYISSFLKPFHLGLGGYVAYNELKNGYKYNVYRLVTARCVCLWVCVGVLVCVCVCLCYYLKFS